MYEITIYSDLIPFAIRSTNLKRVREKQAMAQLARIFSFCQIFAHTWNVLSVYRSRTEICRCDAPIQLQMKNRNRLTFHDSVCAWDAIFTVIERRKNWKWKAQNMSNVRRRMCGTQFCQWGQRSPCDSDVTNVSYSIWQFASIAFHSLTHGFSEPTTNTLTQFSVWHMACQNVQKTHAHTHTRMATQILWTQLLCERGALAAA